MAYKKVFSIFSAVLPFLFFLLFAFTSCFNAYLPPSYPHKSTKTEILYSPKKEASSDHENATSVWNTDRAPSNHVQPNRKLIAFTFDDAPSSSLENLLTIFASYNAENPDCKANATIFCNGGRFDAHTSQILQTALALDMELGNHTFSHYDLTTLSKAEKQKEIEETDRLLSRIDGNAIHLLRAPFGKIDEEVKQIVSVPIIDWSIDTLDWSGISEKDIYNTVFSQKFPGAIVLMHDGYPHTRYALKRLLPDLKEAGYQVVSVSTLAKMHNCALEQGKVYIRARKQK